MMATTWSVPTSVWASEVDVDGLLASSSTIRSILWPLMPPEAFTESAHALVAGGISRTPEANGPVQAQMKPILIGALELLAPATPGPARAAVAASPPPNSTAAMPAATLRSNVLMNRAPPYPPAVLQLGWS